jgi:hypothetical protein
MLPNGNVFLGWGGQWYGEVCLTYSAMLTLESGFQTGRAFTGHSFPRIRFLIGPFERNGMVLLLNPSQYILLPKMPQGT